MGREKKEQFRAFLDSKAPKTVKKELAREPLLLYLLAAMHRDSKIKAENFVSLGDRRSKIEIYNQSLEWVLTKQRPEDLQKDLVKLSGADLEQVLMSAAICVVQSGGEYGKIAAVKERLRESSPHITDKIATMGDDKKQEKALRNAFAAFYLKSAGKGAVEFFHKSFSEFLTAKAMEQSFSQWTKPDAHNREFEVSQEKVEKEIYDLFGYGSLTQEILEYLFGLLERNKKFKPKVLFKGLEYFYLRWCDGEYIDAVPPLNYPQKKMIQLRKASPELGEKTTWGVRQVDIYTGLNVMILLLELQRYGKGHDLEMSFHLCGEVDEGYRIPKYEDQLSRIISYSNSCLSNSSFVGIVGAFLSYANLGKANLQDANLQYANLRNANLQCAYLGNANLQYANLQDANLRNANLEAIKWNENTKWEGVEGLETARNVPEELKRQLSLDI